MSYYQGDYYQGDYYSGDPFLGSLIGMGATWLGKKLLGKGAQAAGKVAIARTGAGAMTGIATGAVGAGVAGMVIPKIMGTGLDIWQTIKGRPSQTQPMQLQQPMMGGCCPSGYHLAKDGSGRCVKNRAMNVANPRALRRSLRRVAGFGKLAARTRKTLKVAARSV